MGRARNCRGGINALARTGTILSSYLRNRNWERKWELVELGREPDYIIVAMEMMGSIMTKKKRKSLKSGHTIFLTLPGSRMGCSRCHLNA